MNIIGVRVWEFDLPEDWELQEPRSGVPYMESNDGTMGCYIKAIAFGQARASGADAASYLQDVHERAFTSGPESGWAVVGRSSSLKGQDYFSTLDLLDRPRNYRVLSVVIAAPTEALQITLHDYHFEDYEASCLVFAPVAQSVRRAPPDA